MNRRDLLKLTAAAGLSYASLSKATVLKDKHQKNGGYFIVTSWMDAQNKFKTGIMEIKDGNISVVCEYDIPSRAHEVIYEGNGNWIVVDRIPGDWIGRYNYKKGLVNLHNIEAGTILFAGHMKKSLDGKLIYTMEYDKPTGQSIVGVRNSHTFKKENEFRTGRTDPHGLILDDKGDIWVSNGGIPKHIPKDAQDVDLHPVETAISQLDAKSGNLKKEWLLDQPKLSIRHLAWGYMNGEKVLGGSIKASHKTQNERKYAPALAILHKEKLEAIDFKLPYEGYVGDIAFSKGSFYLSCTWANKIAVYNPSTKKIMDYDMFESCALKENLNKDVIYAGTKSIATEIGTKEFVLNEKGRAVGVTFENHIDLCPDFNIS